MLKTNDLQDFLYTSMADDINVTINNLYLYIPSLIPSVETQLMFNEATQNKYRIFFDQWYTERRLISDLLVQHYIGSAQQVKSPKYLISAHQTSLRTHTPDKKNNLAIFDNLDLRKNYVEVDGQRYPRDSVLINYEENDYIQQNKKLKLFLKDYRKTILNPLISYPDMKTIYRIEIFDLRHQPDQLTPKNFNCFKNTALIVTMLDCF